MRTKRAFLNLLTDVFPLILISIIGIFKLKYFIQVLGDETLGLYQLFSQIMIYIALVDGGLTTAVLYSLYKPNSSDDKKAMSAILSAAHKIFSKIGILVFGIATIVSFFVPFFIKDSSFENSYIIITFLLFSLSSVINYFFVPYSALLEVREKRYIVNTVNSIGQIIKGLLEITLVLSGFSFITVLVMHSLIALLNSIFIMIMCKKFCPEYSFKSNKPDYSFTKQLGPLIVHKVNGLVGSNIDILIISKFLGLKAVAIYSTYNYIINMLKQILGKITTSLMAIVGNYIASNETNIKKLFYEINSMLFYIATIICVPLLFAINGFIDMWYEGTITTTILMAISFTLVLFVYVIKLTPTMFISSSGLFKETQYCAITDMTINLILSFVLIQYMGMPGVIVATAVAVFISEYILKTKVLYENVLNESSLIYHLKNIKFFIIAALDFVLGYALFSYIPVNNLAMWFLVFGLFAIINSLLILFIYFILGETKFLQRIKILFKNKKE